MNDDITHDANDAGDEQDRIPADLIDTKAASRIARLHISAIRRWIFSGKIRGYRISRRWMVSRGELMEQWKTSAQLAIEQGRLPLPSTRREQRARARYVNQRLQELGVKTGAER